MVFYHCQISVDQHIHMEKTVNSADPCLKLRQINQFYKNRKTSNSQNQLNIQSCEQSRYAMIDVIFFIVTIGAVGVLLNPSVSHLVRKTVELGEEVVDVVREEIVNAPIVFGCLGLSILFTAITLVTIAVCIDRRCGKPGCKGLRKAAEFDLHLETEECVKKSNYAATSGLKKGLIELPVITIGNWKLSSRKWHRLMEELFWCFEQGVDALLEEWRFQAQKSLERLKSSVDAILIS